MYECVLIVKTILNIVEKILNYIKLAYLVNTFKYDHITKYLKNIVSHVKFITDIN